MASKKLIKKPTHTFLLVGLFIVVVAITGFIALSQKIAKSKQEVYIKMKLSQGLWWSSSSNPPIWLAHAIKPDDTESDLFGNTIATVLNKTYYPAEPLKFANQYEVYITMKLAVKQDSGTNKYRYKRNTLSVGSPISIDLSSATVTGSIMEIYHSPPDEQFVTKEITLSNQFAYYSDSPDEFESLMIGDEYFDGQSVAFKVIRKSLSPRQVAFQDLYGKQVVNQIKVNQTIYVNAKIKVKEIDGMFFFGEEQRVTPGANLNILTNTQDFSTYTVVSIK